MLSPWDSVRSNEKCYQEKDYLKAKIEQLQYKYESGETDSNIGNFVIGGVVGLSLGALLVFSLRR